MKTKRSRVVRIAVSFALAITLFHLGIAIAAEPEVVAEKMVTTVKGSEVVVPAKGTSGPGADHNWFPYNVPGEATTGGTISGKKYDIAYADKTTVQSNDWWSGVGLQYGGWVDGRGADLLRTRAIINDPFFYQFLDFSKISKAEDIPVHGLRFWNKTDMHVKTDKGFWPDPKLPDIGNGDSIYNFIGFGQISPAISPIVTLGLDGVHPISADGTNIKIQSYTDWGVVMSYGDTQGELTFTMAKGSPFCWAKRTKGSASFLVWAGAAIGDANGSLHVWHNNDGILGLTVQNGYVPYNHSKDEPSPLPSKAAYVIYADDAGKWDEKSIHSSPGLSRFENSMAEKVVVAAMPHNIDLNDSALISAAKELKPYAWQRIKGTRIHYPPITGSKTAHGSLILGYDESAGVVRTLMEVETEDFESGGASGDALQMVFPHHRKAMIADDKENILTTYTWKTVKGELQAYKGNSYVQELTIYGALPFFPNIAIKSSELKNPLSPDELAVDDVYGAMKQWFYKGELAPSKQTTFARQGIDKYCNSQATNYLPGLGGLIQSAVIADQMAKSGNLEDQDNDLGKPKKDVAIEMRETIYDAIKKILGQWADIYTTGYFQYNPEFRTLYGFFQRAPGTQSITDHHYFYGYFLRAAAAIGRYDPDWLKEYMPLFKEMAHDVANFDRNNNRYPFLRSFCTFYGHNWANGLANGGDGADQESTSEAINFAAGMIELGQVMMGWSGGDWATLGKNWRDIGIYLYEQEILAAEQYWFNQDANLDEDPEGFFNGNWPKQFVRYERNGEQWYTTLVSQVWQNMLSRSTYAGGKQPIKSSYTIQAVPMNALTLWFGRDPVWLAATWDQLMREVDSYGTTPSGNDLSVYEVLMSSIQARLPDPGGSTDIKSHGMTGALKRIARVHPFYEGSSNAQGKYWAYSLNQLGQVDTSIIADISSYGVFKKEGGNRVFVAYNHANEAKDVKFLEKDTSKVVKTITVPAGSMSTFVENGSQTDETLTKKTEVVDDTTRLYLWADSYPASKTGELTLHTTPGSWELSVSSTFNFPNDFNALSGSLVTLPKMTYANDGTRPKSPLTKPDPANNPELKTRLYKSWKCEFSGELVGDPDKAFPQFAIYTNPIMDKDKGGVPGWQQGLSTTSTNAVVLCIEFDYESDGKVDRTETFDAFASATGNSFLYGNMITQYWVQKMVYGPDGGATRHSYKDNLWPEDTPTPYPKTVSNCTVTVSLWDKPLGTNQLAYQIPVPVSVGTKLNSNRASWVSPPYKNIKIIKPPHR